VASGPIPPRTPIVFFLARFIPRRAASVLMLSFFFVGMSSFLVIHRDEEHEGYALKRFHYVFLEAHIGSKVIINKKWPRG
jgi:hypothetical protein